MASFRLGGWRSPPARLARLGFAGVAIAFALVGSARFNADRANFDEAVALYAVAFACALVFAWDVSLPAPREWPLRLAALARRYWLEALLLGAIIAFAVSLRLFRFGDYPPSKLICCGDDEVWNGASRVLDGDRPLVFPLVKYSTVLGFLVFGENTTGLRVPPLMLGVAAIVPFYLLLRQLVRAPAALFACSLLASSRLLLDITTRHQPTMLEAALLALLLVLALRTGSTLAFLALGLISALMSYEYEGYKPIALLALGYIGVVGLYVLLWPRASRHDIIERGRALARQAWRPALAFCLGAGIAIGPLLVGLLAGEDLYFRDYTLHRQAFDNSSETGLVPTDWQGRLEWAAKQFAPVRTDSISDRDPYYDPARNRPLLDPVVASSLFAATAWVIITAWRPFRLFFVAWFLATVFGAALTVIYLNPARLIGAILPGFVLIAFLVDDALRWLPSALGQRAMRLAAAALVVAALYVAYWNLSTFNAIADDPENHAIFVEPILADDLSAEQP